MPVKSSGELAAVFAESPELVQVAINICINKKLKSGLNQLSVPEDAEVFIQTGASVATCSQMLADDLQMGSCDTKNPGLMGQQPKIN